MIQRKTEDICGETKKHPDIFPRSTKLPKWGRGIGAVVDGLLDIPPPEMIIASRGGRRAVAGQVLGRGQVGVGDHITQDRSAEILSGGSRQADLLYSLSQDRMQGFWGQVLVQPLQNA